MVLFAVPTVQALPQGVSLFCFFPPSLKQEVLHQVHPVQAIIQGYQKTLSCLKADAYWSSMASDVQQ